MMVSQLDRSFISRTASKELFGKVVKLASPDAELLLGNVVTRLDRRLGFF